MARLCLPDLGENMFVHIHGLRVRAHSETGPYYIVTPNEAIESVMDKYYMRRRGTLIWDNPNRLSTEILKDKYPGSTALIVGKGPSLDELTKEHIDSSWIVFCCNESISRVASLGLENNIFAVQVDMNVYSGCRSDYPILCALKCIYNYNNEKDTVYYFTSDMVGKQDAIVGQAAIVLAKQMGATSLRLVGFDGAFGGSCEYAKVTGLSASIAGPKSRFKTHQRYLLSAIGETPYEVLWPGARPVIQESCTEPISMPSTDKVQSESSSDNTPQLPEHLRRLCVDADFQQIIENINTGDSL